MLKKYREMLFQCKKAAMTICAIFKFAKNIILILQLV